MPTARAGYTRDSSTTGPIQITNAYGTGSSTKDFTVVAAPAANPDNVITAPMVGTFYSAAAPGAKPFVQLGSEVKAGDVLCIIEAMKMMNQIESEKEGRIASILVRDGEPVEFGQPLFVIE